MRSLLVTAFVACLAGVSAHGVVDKTNIKQAFAEADRHEFHAFMVRYVKTYETPDAMERAFQIFQTNKAKIDQMNAKEGKTIYGVNQFTDIDPVEFRKMYTGFKPDPRNAPIRRAAPVMEADLSVLANVTAWDWRDHGAVSPVKNQGQCGSCWAFSATQATESAWFLKGNTLPILAPQQIVDCDTVDQGCNGGDTITAYAYLEKTSGLEAEASYPYTGVGGTCAYSASSAVATVSNFTYATPPCPDSSCTNQDEQTLAANIASTGPASICVNANDAWQSYVSGVVTASTSCPNAYDQLNHCVHLVGFNVDSNGNQYWLVKNSWGPSWGNGGYIYIQLGSNICGIADEATFVTP